jgi:hypothetical protein
VSAVPRCCGLCISASQRQSSQRGISEPPPATFLEGFNLMMQKRLRIIMGCGLLLYFPIADAKVNLSTIQSFCPEHISSLTPTSEAGILGQSRVSCPQSGRKRWRRKGDFYGPSTPTIGERKLTTFEMIADQGTCREPLTCSASISQNPWFSLDTQLLPMKDSSSTGHFCIGSTELRNQRFRGKQPTLHCVP